MKSTLPIATTIPWKRPIWKMQQKPQETRFQNIYSMGKVEIQEVRKFYLTKIPMAGTHHTLHLKISFSQTALHPVSMCLFFWECVCDTKRKEEENGRGEREIML
jgi:hypothetical protein